MVNRSDLETLSIEALYEWVNRKYDLYSEGEISEEEYLSDLDYYKGRLARSQEEPTDTPRQTKAISKEKPMNTRVRSTSIAGLRKKLMDELQK